MPSNEGPNIVPTGIGAKSPAEIYAEEQEKK